MWMNDMAGLKVIGGLGIYANFLGLLKLVGTYNLS